MDAEQMVDGALALLEQMAEEPGEVLAALGQTEHPEVVARLRALAERAAALREGERRQLDEVDEWHARSVEAVLTEARRRTTGAVPVAEQADVRSRDSRFLEQRLRDVDALARERRREVRARAAAAWVRHEEEAAAVRAAYDRRRAGGERQGASGGPGASPDR